MPTCFDNSPYEITYTEKHFPLPFHSHKNIIGCVYSPK